MELKDYVRPLVKWGWLIVAQGLAEELIRVRPTGPGGEDQQRQAFVSQRLNDLESKIQETQAEIDRKQAELADMFGARQISDTQTQITGLQKRPPSASCWQPELRTCWNTWTTP